VGGLALVPAAAAAPSLSWLVMVVAR